MQTLLAFLLLLQAALPSITCITPPHDLGRPGERDAGNLTIDQAIRGTLDENAPATIMAADGLILAELDMMLTKDQYKNLYERGNLFKRKATADLSKRWPGHTLKYAFKAGHFSFYEQYMIRRAMTDWERYTCINMEPADKNDHDYVRIQNGMGCNSQLGLVGGPQPLNLEYPGCRYKGLYLHELGHAIGLVHEQQLPSRDKWIDIIWENVKEEWKPWFKKYTTSEVDEMDVPYEYSSIMHYGITAFSKGDGNLQTIKAKYPEREEEIGKVYLKELAYTDVEIVNKMYNCAGHCPDKTKCGTKGHLDQNCNCICKDGSQDCDTTKTPVDKSCTNKYKDWACYIWANQGECEKNAKFMHPACQKACGVCDKTQTLPSPCKNVFIDKKCDKWAKRGDCLTNTNWMTSHCPVSCNMCTPGGNKAKESCKDTYTDPGKVGTKCDEWAKSGECVANPIGMFNNCQRSCMHCDVTLDEIKLSSKDPFKDIEMPDIDTGACVNKNEHCNEWAEKGECKSNPTWMIPHCRKACDKCDDKTCKNLYDDNICTNWARQGECKANPHAMLYQCAKACASGPCEGQATPSPTPWTCGNRNENCEKWAERGDCDSSPKHMIPMCRKACNKCPDGTCQNLFHDKKCTDWALRGECNKNPIFMLKHCAKACGSGLCEGHPTPTRPTPAPTTTPLPTTTPEHPCVDEAKTSDCEVWAKRGHCEIVKSVRRSCRKTCKVCKPDESSEVTTPMPTEDSTGCTNESKNCEDWAAVGGCERNPGYMLTDCRKACKVC